MDSTLTSALETTGCRCLRWVEIEADGMKGMPEEEEEDEEHENSEDGCTAAADGKDGCSEGAIRALSS